MTKHSKLITTFIILPALLLAATLTGKVIGVSDGDTIKILTADKQQIKIRLWGIDCPEKSQAFGMKAKQFASDMVYGKRVSVISHGADRYGRTIGEVLVNGKSLNKALVENGYAWWYKQYSPKAYDLEKLEVEARANKKGLWADPNAKAPWEYRKAKRSGSSSSTYKKPDSSGNHSVNRKSGKRHNSSCRYYNCSNCAPSSATAGIACKVCGG